MSDTLEREYDEDDVMEARRDEAERWNPELAQDRLDREFMNEVDREIGILQAQCTDIKFAEQYVADYIADPYRFAGEIVRLAALYRDDNVALGGLVACMIRDRWFLDASFIVNKDYQVNHD